MTSAQSGDSPPPRSRSLRSITGRSTGTVRWDLRARWPMSRMAARRSGPLRRAPAGPRSLIAQIFGMPREKVRVVYLDGSGSYGSNGAYDAAADAVLLSRAVSQPVRLQWMRQDEHGWDPKGPAQLLEMRGALDSDGKLAAFESRGIAPTGPQWTEALLGPRRRGCARGR